MARLLGPDPSTRQVLQYTKTRSIIGFPNKNLTVYTDSACTVPAAIAAHQAGAPRVPGPLIDNSVITVGQDSRLPMFWFPEGYDALWVANSSGSFKQRVTASVDLRFDNPMMRTDRVLRAMPVTNNNWVASSVTLSSAAGTARSRHRVHVDCADIRLVYGGFWTSNPSGQYGTDADQAAAIPIKASIEVAGAVYPVTFGGQIQGSVDPGGLLTSDPLPVEFTAGSDLYVRTYTSSTSFYSNTASFGTATGGWSASDLTASGAAAVPDVGHWMFAPMAVCGTPASRSAASVTIIGDSLSVGSGENAAGTAASAGWATGNVLAGGFIGRALSAGNIPWINIGHGGERAYRFVSFANRFRRTAFLSGVTHVICDLGVNDVFSGQTLAQIQANWIIIWKLAQQRGCRVWQTTITPSTTSTDSFVTVGNQTTANTGQETTRVALNGWLRDGAPLVSGAPVATGSTAAGVIRAGSATHPLSGFFEIAYTVESAPNSGLWKANFTTDGLHPTSAGHIAAAAGIDTTLLAL